MNTAISQRHTHQQAAQQQAETSPDRFAWSRSRYQPTWPTTSIVVPTTMLKISNFSQSVSWLSKCKRDEGQSGLGDRHRPRTTDGQSACCTSHAASRLSAIRASSRNTSDQWMAPGCVASRLERDQRGGHKRQRHQGVGALERGVDQARPFQHGQPIADQQGQPQDGEGRACNTRRRPASTGAVATRRRRPWPCRDRR